MRVISWAAVLAVVGMIAGAPSGARADVTYNLVTAGTLPASPSYGTVNVLSVSGNPDELEIQVQLTGTNHFANTGIDASFAFDLTGIGSITVSGLPTSPTTWSALNTSGAGLTSAGTIHNDGAGNFDYGLTFAYLPCNKQNGCGNTDGQSLDFIITATTALSPTLVSGVSADVCTLGPNDSNNCGTGGLTGAVVGVPVPGPLVGAGLPGLIAACAGLAAFARRRRNRLA